MTNGSDDYFPADDLDAPATTAARSGKAGYVLPEKQFAEGCPKCRGTGQFVSYSGRILGQCFACKGAGKRVFATSPETRAKSRDRAIVKRVQAVQDATASAKAWLEANPAEAAWLYRKHSDTFTFPADLLAKLHQYGSLTDAQIAAVRKLMARDAERTAERAAAAPVVEAAGIDRLKAAFDQAAVYTAAKAKGLTVRSPKITVGGITISPAKATSANAGALYVKTKRPSFVKYLPGQDADDSIYLGKIMGGRFMASRDCTPEQSAQVLAFVANPAEAAKVYGQETGVCCICNATLRSEWRLRGIGPICAEKFGW